MDSANGTASFLELLNQAVARELQVCIQYMFQHSIGVPEGYVIGGKSLPARQGKFVASDSPFWLPGATLKKVAIVEMRHAEAIAERVVALGGEPTTQPADVVIGESVEERLRNDREQERGAIALYRRIIATATEERDDATRGLFERILRDEEQHHRLFSELLGEGS